MLKTKAKVKFQGARKTPIGSGIRPTFFFDNNINVMGVIRLLNKEALYPDDEEIIEIVFPFNELLPLNFDIGSNFTFGEHPKYLYGQGKITEIETS